MGVTFEISHAFIIIIIIIIIIINIIIIIIIILDLAWNENFTHRLSAMFTCLDGESGIVTKCTFVTKFRSTE